MLVPLPTQPADVPWPTEKWPAAALDPAVDRERIDAALAPIFDSAREEELGRTHAVLVAHRGRLVLERYAPGVGPSSTLPSWSMAKSILQAAVGVLVRDGKLDVRARADVPEWSDPADSRHGITLDQLLRMSAGLLFNEDYVDEDVSHCIQMLFGSGRADVAGYAGALPLVHPPDTHFNYSSGTSNIISRLLHRTLGVGREGMVRFLSSEIFGPLGMRSAAPRYDDAGTWIASSFVFATARDFARFGLLYLRDGVWDGRRILPEGWVDYARTRTPASTDAEPYGAHWWLSPGGGRLGTFFASGYRGQRVLLVPALDLILVRLGETPVERMPGVIERLGEVVRAFLPALPPGVALPTR